MTSRISVSEPRDVVESAYAIMLTFLPLAFFSISRLKWRARSSIDAEAGTEVVMTSTPLVLNASAIPRQ